MLNSHNMGSFQEEIETQFSSIVNPIVHNIICHAIATRVVTLRLPMDNDLRCNRLNCRRVLIDKAVVVSCVSILVDFHCRRLRS